MEAGEAELIVVLTPDGPHLLPASAFEDGEDCPGMDSHNLLHRATLRNARPLSSAASSNAHRSRALLLSAAYASGLSKAALDMAVDYAKMREQFGKVIGEFQALQHRAAHLYSEVEIARAVTVKAAQLVDGGSEKADLMASVAKAKVAKVAGLAVREGVQMHGGIGMTDEYDIGLYMKRDRALQELSLIHI